MFIRLITLIIFSKDRALQLDSLLRSIQDFCIGIDRIVVLAKVSSQLHETTYDNLRAISKYCDFIVRRPSDIYTLGNDIRTALNDSSYVALAVDDMTYYAVSNYKKATNLLINQNAFVWSWRLGCAACTILDKTTKTFWKCTSTVQDPNYAYMWHTDGSLYKKDTYVNMLDKWLPDYKICQYTPYDLESKIYANKIYWENSVECHIGPHKPTCITWQLNTTKNNYTDSGADYLARLYLSGKRVNNTKVYAALQQDALQFNDSKDRPTHVSANKKALMFFESCVQ